MSHVLVQDRETEQAQKALRCIGGPLNKQYHAAGAGAEYLTVPLADGQLAIYRQARDRGESVWVLLHAIGRDDADAEFAKDAASFTPLEAA